MSGCSFTAWEKVSIPIDKASNIGRVKVVSGTPISLEEATNQKEKLWVAFKSDSVRVYDYIAYYEDHYYGFVETNFYLLEKKKIRGIFSESGLSRREYRKILLLSEEGYYGEVDHLIQLDTSAICAIYKVDESGSRQTSRAIAFLTITIALIFISSVSWILAYGF